MQVSGTCFYQCPVCDDRLFAPLQHDVIPQLGAHRYHLLSLPRNRFLQSSQYHFAAFHKKKLVSFRPKLRNKMGPTKPRGLPDEITETWDGRKQHKLRIEMQGHVNKKSTRDENSPFPFGATFNPTHSRWNHSLGHPSPSQATISP